MRRRHVIASAVAAIALAASTSLTGSAAGGAAVPEAAVAPAAAAPVAMPEIGVLEDALPPGARNFLAGVRIIKGLGARNRVYREARHVQSDLRAYYDAQIETARQQLLDREQLGLRDSQVRAYWRVLDQLKAEKSAAMSITEDEKRAAKYRFESALKQEMMSALIRVPRMRRGLERAKEAIEDLREGFEKVRVALEGGNPISVAIGDLRSKLDKLDRAARVGGLINGNLGATLGGVSKWAGDALDRLEAPLDEAAGVANEAIGQLDGLTTGIEDGLESTRTVRADAALEQAAANLVDRVFAPGGRGGTPEVDVVADAIARDTITATQRNVGVAIGAIDPADFRRMSERVHAAMLGRSLERIGEICGRLTGAAQRLELEAAANGEPVPDTSTPCTLFGDPEALQAYIDSQNAEPDDSTPDTTVEVAGADPAPDPVSGELTIDGTYVGTFDVSEMFGDIESEPGVTLEVNEFRVVVADAMVQSLAGQFGLGFVCDEGPNAGAPLAYYVLIDGSAGTELVTESNDWYVSMPMTLTADARGDCPPPPDDDGGFDLDADDFDASVGGQIDLDFSTDVVTFEIVSDEDEDDGALTGTLTRE